MLDIAGECHVTDRRLLLGRKRLVRVENPFVTALSKKSSTLMGSWKYNHE
jgi:hypothetical protein